MKEILTKDFATRKKVIIDGHQYSVRRIGAGEELRASQMSREADRISNRLRKDGAVSDEDMLKLEELSAESLELYINTFDDGMNFEKSRKLLSSLSIVERIILYNRVWDIDRDLSKVVEEAEGLYQNAAQEQSAEPAAEATS